VQNTTQKRLSTMNMRPAIIEKPPQHHASGSHEKAGHHAHIAHGHHLHATHHAEEAAKHHAEEHGSK